ncbi:MAG: dehydrogenase E1 component subunit alpha/beta [Planctomycetes bacterium]|nr:dehydrogenase E1 component subunit alpha/beta [Planctomycetota bacterium]
MDRALLDFLAVEAPYLIPEATSLGDLRKAIQRISADPTPLWPGVTAGEAAGWTREALLEQLDGFVRRREIKKSLTAGERREMYRGMLLTREVDNLCKRWFVEKKIAWTAPDGTVYPSPQKGFRSWGQEAIVGVAARLRRGPGGDLVAPIIRDVGVQLMWSGDVENVLCAQSGKLGGPMGGRDLHIGDLECGVLPATAPLAIATQTLIGVAYAFKLDRSDRVAVSFIGEGGSSLGEWHEAINFAAAQRLNMIFFVQNNHWALGTHWSEQTAARRFAAKGAGYGIPGLTIFGNDPDEIAAATAWAAERARAGKGPALIELVTYRRAGHAHHDDERFHGVPQHKVPGYELDEERALWEKADPIELYEKRLLDEGILEASDPERMRRDVAAVVEAAARKVEAAPWPDPAPQVERVFAVREDATPPPSARATKRAGYDEAVRLALSELLESDPRVFLLGEDVGGRYGGAFGVTRGLAKRFGADRVLNTPLAESAIVGAAVGAALMGKRPIVEMQFADFLTPGFNAFVNNAAKIHWRYGKRVPMVVRLPYGGATGTMNRLLGGGPFHSQCPEAWFLRTPGWKIVAPSTPSDAKGLLVAAVRDGNPVIYLESKGLYSLFRTDLLEEVPLGGDFEVPIGKAEVRREGKDVTCATYGAMAWTALDAAQTLHAEGISLEVLDLRSLVPLDEEALLNSVAKTHRLLVLHEDSRRGGPGAELAALVAEKAIYELEAPIARVAAPDQPVPYAPPLEWAHLPKASDVVEAARRLMR